MESHCRSGCQALVSFQVCADFLETMSELSFLDYHVSSSRSSWGFAWTSSGTMSARLKLWKAGYKTLDLMSPLFLRLKHQQMNRQAQSQKP